MPLLTTAQASDLRTELAKPGYSGLNRLAACDAVNRPIEISNGPAPQVPLPLSTRQEEFFTVLNEVSVGKMTTSQLLVRALDHIDNNDHRKLLLVVATAKKANIISGQEALEIQRLALKTVPDPNFIATRIGPSAFQAIRGLGDVPIVHPDGHITVGTCTPEMIDEARA